MKSRPLVLKLNHSRDELKKIKIVMKQETVDDPYEKNLTTTIKFNPLYIKGMIREISPSRITWELYGLKDMGAVELVCDKKYLTILQKATNLYIGKEEYLIYKTANGKHSSITQKNDYLVAILERKA